MYRLLVFVTAIFATILVSQFEKASAQGLDNGVACAYKYAGIRGDEPNLRYDDIKCASNACYPGPSISGQPKTTWFCVARSKSCAIPGSAGGMFGDIFKYPVPGGTLTLRCQDTGIKARSRFAN